MVVQHIETTYNVSVGCLVQSWVELISISHDTGRQTDCLGDVIARIRRIGKTDQHVLGALRVA